MAEQLQPHEGFLHSYEVFRDLRMRRLPDLHGNEGNPNRGKNPIDRAPRQLVPADVDQGAYVGSTFTPEELSLIIPAIRLLATTAQSGFQSEQDPDSTCAPLTDLIVARYANDESRATFAQAVFLGTHHLVDFVAAAFPTHAPALEGLFEVSGDEGIRVAVHKSRDLLEKAQQGTLPPMGDILPRPNSFANMRVDGYERWEIQCPGMVLGRQIMASATRAAAELGELITCGQFDETAWPREQSALIAMEDEIKYAVRARMHEHEQAILGPQAARRYPQLPAYFSR